MEVQILQLLDGARQAEGLTVIIDVFRAFTVACYLTENGAEKLIPVADLELAYNLKKQHADYLLVGERNERIAPGFDYGNCPTHIKNIDFTGKTVIHTTSSGTQGISNAIHAQQIITGSFVNANAIIRYIRQQNPEKVSLVCMGFATRYPIEEDTFCAEYIKCHLENTAFDFAHSVEVIKKTSAARFYDPANADWSPSSDVDLCLELDRFNFVLKTEKSEDGLFFLNKIPV